jgi:hypothetical protein
VTNRRSFAIGCPTAFLVFCLGLYLTGGFHIIWGGNWGGNTDSVPSQNAEKALMLSTAELAGFAPGPNDPLMQVGEGMPDPAAYQRVFFDQADTLHIEDDLQFFVSDADAFAAYPAFLDAIKVVETSTSSHSSPSIGSQSDEYLGTDSTGHSTVALVFQEGSVLGGVLVSVSAGKVDTVYADTFAGAQDQKILKGSST